MLDNSATGVTQLDLRALKSGMTDSFTLEDIREITFDLRIDFDDLTGGTKVSKVIALIEYTKNRGMLQDLVAYVQRVRPNLRLQQPMSAAPSSPVTVEERILHRHALRDEFRDIYLSHTLRPAPMRPGWYDILIYLAAHKEARIDKVSYGEFFLGGGWKNRLFKSETQDGFVGISVSAYGPFLCTCRIVFDDGQQVFQERYINLAEVGEPRPQ